MNEREALAELVALKDLKDRLHKLHEMGHGTDYDDYHRRQPLAWAAARAALAQPAVPAPDRYSELAEALGCDCMDSHAGRIARAKRLAEKEKQA